MEQLGSHWTDFLETFEYFSKICRESARFIKVWQIKEGTLSYSSLTSSKSTRFFISMHSSSFRSGILTVGFAFSIGSATLVWCDVNHKNFISRNHFGSISVSTAWLRRTVNLNFLWHSLRTRKKKDDTISPLCFFLILGLKWGIIRGLFKKYPDWNCSGCSLFGMCLQPVLTCSYMS
jgi:hypothetical protein